MEQLACDYKHKGCGFDSHLGMNNEIIIKYLLFSFRNSGNNAKRGVEFRYSTRNASRSRHKRENGSPNGNVLILYSLCPIFLS